MLFTGHASLRNVHMYGRAGREAFERQTVHHDALALLSLGVLVRCAA
jgi:hypothetical protein